MEQLIVGNPVIAVLTEITVDDKKEPVFGKIHTFCEELNQLVKEFGGFFYVFSLRDFSKESISGFYLDGEHWVKANLPFPFVIYNRVHSRRTEASKRFATFIEVTNELNIAVFNRSFLTKWEVHKWLAERESLESFLPETCLYSNKALMKMHESCPELYLKPLTGSQGRGIFRVRTGKEISTSFSVNNGTEHFQFSTIDGLIHAVTKKIKKRPYLIQQGIPLLKLEERSVDFRVLCHRTGSKHWMVTSVVARLSAEHHFASNLALGGELIRPLKVLSVFFEKEAAYQKLVFMKELALMVADCISENVSGLMGELGVDIGVDASGELWIIEVNSKPSKNFEDGSGRIRPSAKAIIDYCNKLLDERSEGED